MTRFDKLMYVLLFSTVAAMCVYGIVMVTAEGRQ